MSEILVAHIISCAAMFGIIWAVQLLIYPGFQYIAPNQFKDMHDKHTTRITWIVGPLMLIELVSAAWIFLSNMTLFWICNLLSIVVLWLFTAFVSVPIHNRLANGEKSLKDIEKLTNTNWPRTILWTARTGALFYFLTEILWV